MNSPSPQQPRSPRRVDLDRFGWALAAYSAIGYLVCFWRLGTARLIQMEGMVADAGRRMVESGDWLVPRVYGEIYTFKPALAYWLASLAYRVAEPPSEWLLRLPFAASIFGLGLAVLLLMRRLVGNRAAALSAIASVSGVVVIEKVKLAEFDGVLTAGVGLAVVAACYNLSASRVRAPVWLLGYLGLTVGFLAKGVPALMLYPPGVLAAAVATRRIARLWRPSHLFAALMFLISSGGYLLGVYAAAGPAAFEQPLAESRVRGFGWLERQLEDQERVDLLQQGEFLLAGDEAEVASRPWLALGRTLVKPFLILAAFLPWSLVLPFALRRRPLGLRRRLIDSEPRERGLVVRAAGAFLLAGMVVFMAVPTHAMRYYMPLCLPVGLLAGLVIDGLDRTAAQRASWRRRLLVACLVMAVLAAALAIAGAVLFETPPVTPAQRLALVLVGLLALAASISAGRGRTREPTALLLGVAALCLIAVNTLGIQARKAERRNLRAQAAEISRHLPPAQPVWVLGPSDLAGKNSSLLFYLEREVLAFRLGGPHPPAGAFCIVPSDRLDELAYAPDLGFETVTRVEHRSRDFLLGTCSTTQPRRGLPG